MHEIFTPEDKRFYEWISLIREPQGVRVQILNELIEVHVGDKYQAGELWRALPILKLGQGSLKHVDLWIGKRLYLYTRHRLTLDDIAIKPPKRKKP